MYRSSNSRFIRNIFYNLSHAITIILMFFTYTFPRIITKDTRTNFSIFQRLATKCIKLLLIVFPDLVMGFIQSLALLRNVFFGKIKVPRKRFTRSFYFYSLTLQMLIYEIHSTKLVCEYYANCDLISISFACQ